MKTKRTQHAVTCGALGAAVVCALTGLESAADTVALKEIVVTATKRGELSVQEIPAGISAISSDAIEKNSLRSLDEYARANPSLTFASQGSGDSQLIIRGIQSPGSSTVGFYFDEAVITASNFQDGGGRTPDIRLYDVERVEVLKGPQGTLFGASAMSGAVRIITKKPDATAFDAGVSLGGSMVEHGDAGYELSGMVNIPVARDVLAMRAVGWREVKGGFIDHFAGLNGALRIDDANDSRTNGGRLSVKLTPNERFQLTVFGLVQDSHVDDTQAFYPKASGTLLPIPFVFVPGVTFGPFGGEFGDLKVTKPSREPWDDKIYLYGLTAELDVGAGDVLATANYFDRDIWSPFDTSPTSLSFGLPAPAVTGSQFQNRKVFSAELRFVSKFEGPFNFVAGVFHESDNNFNTLDVLAADPATGILACRTQKDCLKSPSLVHNIIFGRTLESDLDFYRLFGHADFKFNDQWTLGAGVAYFDGQMHNTEFTTQALPPTALPPVLGGPPQAAPIPGVNEFADTDKITWDASLSYQHTPEQMYYVRAATGFRPGGINDTSLGSFFGIEIPPTFKPDTVLSLELGAKTTWLEDRLTLNAALFRMYWKDILVPGEEPTGAFEFIANAAKARINGVELELQARPSDPWYMSLGVTWLDAQLSRDQTFPPGYVPLPSTPRGFDGDRIPKVPKWSASGNLEYTLPMTVGGGQPVLRANFSYTSSSRTYFNNTDPYAVKIGDYFLLNLNAGFPVGNNLELRLFVNNVTDKLAIVDADNGIDGYDAFTVRPRTIGAQAIWRLK
ncbi:MAG: TonB-dependent receptor [Steroidobacteraceae bacterium]